MMNTLMTINQTLGVARIGLKYLFTQIHEIYCISSSQELLKKKLNSWRIDSQDYKLYHEQGNLLMEMAISLSNSFKSTIISYTACLICLTDFENVEKEAIFRMTKINIGKMNENINKITSRYHTLYRNDY